MSKCNDLFFDQETRDDLTSRLIDYLHIGGIFVAGQAESVAGRHKRLKSIRPSVYRRVS